MKTPRRVGVRKARLTNSSVDNGGDVATPGGFINVGEEVKRNEVVCVV